MYCKGGFPECRLLCGLDMLQMYYHLFSTFFFFFFCLFAISWAAPTAYGGSQARGPIRAVATGPRQSHSNARSEPCLQPTPEPQQRWVLNPLSKVRDRTGNLMVPSYSLTTAPPQELWYLISNLIALCLEKMLNVISVFLFTKACLMAQHVIYPGKCSMCT